MKIYFYNAGCGDACRIQYLGRDGQARNVFIDSGYERTYRDILAEEITSIQNEGQKIDLWVLSHIHNDHIGGATGYVGAVQARHRADIVERWWYNPPRKAVIAPVATTVSIAKSIKQAGLLTSYLDFRNMLPTEPITNLLRPFNLHGMQIQILSPNIVVLEKLLKKYEDPKMPIETLEDGLLSEAVSRRSRDYYIKASDYDLSFWEEDKNLENGSSIALITDLDGQKVLWLADAFASTVTDSLITLGYSEDNPLHCRFVKLSHHGSLGNNSDRLYGMIVCANYIVSVDGYNKHSLPTKGCILRILLHQRRDRTIKYTFYFTVDDSILRSMFAIDGDGIFELLNFEMVFADDRKGLVFNL